VQAVGVVPGVRERAAARVPSEVVQFVAPGRQIAPADDVAVAVGRRIGVQHDERVRLFGGAVERDQIGERFRGAAIESDALR
jgi:hypothetical protein